MLLHKIELGLVEPPPGVSLEAMANAREAMQQPGYPIRFH